MKWRGIRRQSLDVSTTSEEGLLAINSRFKVDGEMRRRRGLARTSIQKKNASVTNLSGFSAFQSNVMAALTDGDRIQGYLNPYALWGDNPAPYVEPEVYNPIWGYTFTDSLEDLNGGNAFSMVPDIEVYSTWRGAEPNIWYTAGNNPVSDTVSVTATGTGDCTLFVCLYADAALTNPGKYIDVNVGRFRARLSNYQDLTLYDQDGTVIYTLAVTAEAAYDIAFVSEGGVLTAYVDGVSVYIGAEPTPTGITTCAIEIAGYTFGTCGIGDLFCWSRALTSDQISDVRTERSTRPWE